MSFILLHVAIQFSQHHLFKRLSIVNFWLLCYKFIDNICMGLFLGFLFCSIDLCFCFYAHTILCWLPKLCSIIWNQGAWYLHFCSCFSILFWLFRVLCGFIYILGLFYFSEKCCWSFDNDFIDFVDYFGQPRHFNNVLIHEVRMGYLSICVLNLIGCSVAYCLISTYLWFFQFSYDWFPVSYHFGQKRFLIQFQSS